ncbi:MAG: hypothetical protein LBF22_11705 [Deltaproteobacteria bacterium]|nr:hypothetical protein [Deltaproteobacteria bacterium]
MEETGAPPELASWEKWVLYQSYPACYDEDFYTSRALCALPQTLTLNLTQTGGEFTAVYFVRDKSPVYLPGDSKLWPREVKENSPLPVSRNPKNDRPFVTLEKGIHTLTGKWTWNALPETLTLPLEPILSINLDGKPLDFPNQDLDFKNLTVTVWLLSATDQPQPPPQKEDQVEASTQNELTVKVTRLISDTQPLRIITHLKISVAGTPREELIQNILPSAESIPIQLDSPLPAQLTSEGLRLQVRPGVFEIFLVSREQTDITQLGPVIGTFGTEYWAYSPDPTLRQVEITGAPQVDPNLVDIPWTNYPVYVLEPGNSLTFNVVRRGDPDPGPNLLQLNRTCWVDFSGIGLTCRDSLQGQMRRDWFLAVDSPFEIGQASLENIPQVITWQTNSRGEKAPGLQLRKGNFSITADLRINDFQGVLPASGWDQNLQSSSQVLKLPPGFKLLHVSGATAVNSAGYPESFREKWTTLDLFIVLVIIVATLKLLGLRWGILGGLALIISYHEFMCPRIVYLHILAAIAILKVLPEQGKARFLVRAWKFLAALVLIGFAFFFVITQARYAMFPQLEDLSSPQRGGVGYPVSTNFYNYGLPNSFTSGTISSSENDYYFESEAPASPPDSSFSQMMPESDSAPLPMDSANIMEPVVGGVRPPNKKSQVTRSSPPRSSSARGMSQNSQLTIKTEAKAQNSIPRPSWNFLTIYLNLNDQVTREQNTDVYIIPPLANRILGFLRVILIAWFSIVILGYPKSWKVFHKPDPNSRETPDSDNHPENLTSSDAAPTDAASSDAAPTDAAPTDATPTNAAQNSPAGSTSLGLALLLIPLLFLFNVNLSFAQTSEAFPHPDLLEDLEDRLSASETPFLPGIPELNIQPSKDKLTLSYQVEVAVRDNFVALPTLDNNFFRLRSVTLETGTDLPILAKNKTSLLFAFIPTGFHTLTLEFQQKPNNSFQIRFPEKYVPQKITLANDLYTINGLDSNGKPTGNAVFLTLNSPPVAVEETSGLAADPNSEGPDQADQADQPDPADPDILPTTDPKNTVSPAGNALSPYYRVHRTVSLGLELKFLTRVTLITSIGDTPVTLTLPLLKNEKPNAPGIIFRNQEAILQFSANQKEFYWESVIPADPDSSITLTASEGPYEEIWDLDAATLWSVKTEGFTPIFNISPQGYWNPTWRPWPGETLKLSLSRPEPIPGQFLVADQAQVIIILGEENRFLSLNLKLRSSQGENRPIQLPPGAEVTDVILNGRSIPFIANPSPEGPIVNIPLNPGDHTLNINWIDTLPISAITRAPKLNLGILTSNIDISMEIPQTRWTIFLGGPIQGPAVLFWSFSAATLIFAFILAYLKITPLRTLSWFLLLLGLSQLSFTSALFVTGWLLVLGLRGKSKTIKGPNLFNFTQILLCLWTGLALYLFYRGLTHGLLDAPNMTVQGNGSSDHYLRWFYDRTEGPFPEAWALTLPIRIYQYIMLAWALWMAINIIRWLRWGFKCFSHETMWKHYPNTSSSPHQVSDATPNRDSGPRPNQAFGPRPNQAFGPRPNQAFGPKPPQAPQPENPDNFTPEPPSPENAPDSKTDSKTDPSDPEKP